MTAADVSIAPLVDVWQPFVNAIVAIIVPMLVAWGFSIFSKYTGVQVDAAYKKEITDAVANEAQKIVVHADSSIATAAIPMSDPRCATAAQRIIKASAPQLQKALKATGATPELIASMIAGKLGDLQIRMVGGGTPSH